MTIGLLLIAFLTPPFGVRAYLDARAQTASDSSRMAFSVTRPAGSISKLPATAFATSTPVPLDGIRGKGAWFMIFNGDWTDADADRARALVDSAVSADLSHIYVRVADSRRHFYGAPALQDLLPIAHAHHLRVIGWIEPMLNDPTQDAADAIAAARYQEQGQRLDGLALTMEAIRREPNVSQYLSQVRSGASRLAGLGDRYLLKHPPYARGPSWGRLRGHVTLLPGLRSDGLLAGDRVAPVQRSERRPVVSGPDLRAVQGSVDQPIQPAADDNRPGV